MENRHPHDIAVVGMAGIFPGASNIAQFWNNITRRHSAIRPVAPGRWPVAPEKVMDPSGPPDHAGTD